MAQMEGWVVFLLEDKTRSPKAIGYDDLMIFEGFELHQVGEFDDKVFLSHCWRF